MRDTLFFIEFEEVGYEEIVEMKKKDQKLSIYEVSEVESPREKKLLFARYRVFCVDKFINISNIEDFSMKAVRKNISLKTA